MSDGTPGEGTELAELKEKISQLESTNARLLDESVRNKDLYKQAKASLDETEKEKLKAKGETEAVLNKTTEELSATKSVLSRIAQKATDKELKVQLSTLAPDAVDLEDLVDYSRKSDLVKYDYEEITVAGVEEFLKSAREKKPHFFNKAALPPTENNPPGKNVSEPKTDKQKYFAELDAAKTQAEYDAVRAKWGRG